MSKISKWFDRFIDKMIVVKPIMTAEEMRKLVEKQLNEACNGK